MDICVVVRSLDNLDQAGTRIRYLRLADALGRLGHRLCVEPIDTFRSAAQLGHDVYWLSKCHDARAQLLSHLCAAKGKLLGIDLFDDSFSQAGDSRLLPERQWLRSASACFDFATCSTERLQTLLATLLPDTPAHRLADPGEPLDLPALSARLNAALDRAHRSRQIDVAWFGMGDHPLFNVGLHDLHAFAPALASLRSAGWQPVLRVLTNRRALGAGALERLARLPLPWTLDEWSPEGEAALLASSLVAFLPVNAQAFSAAKSHNRAVTALSAGAQVLSAGLPLYDTLQPLVYRNPVELVDDLAQRRLRLREQTVPELAARLQLQADASREAAGLAGFLQALRRRPGSGKAMPTLALLHGLRSEKAVHEMAQRTRQLSVGGPYANPGLNYDIRLVRDAACLQVQLGDAALPLLRPELQRSLVAATSATGRAVKAIDATRVAPQAAELLARALDDRTPAERLARYAPAMRATADLVRALFMRVQPIVSESEAPFHVELPAELRP